MDLQIWNEEVVMVILGECGISLDRLKFVIHKAQMSRWWAFPPPLAASLFDMLPSLSPITFAFVMMFFCEGDWIVQVLYKGLKPCMSQLLYSFFFDGDFTISRQRIQVSVSTALKVSLPGHGLPAHRPITCYESFLMGLVLTSVSRLGSVLFLNLSVDCR